MARATPLTSDYGLKVSINSINLYGPTPFRIFFNKIADTLFQNHIFFCKMKKQHNYYDRDLRLKCTDGNETEHREVVYYGDECYLELDSVGQVDDTVDFTSKSEVTYEKSKENKPGKHSTSKYKRMSGKTADTSAPEVGVNSSENVTSGHVTQGIYSTILYERKDNSSKSIRDVSTVAVANKPFNELYDNKEEDRNNRKRKRLGQHYEQEQKIKSQRIAESTDCLENNIPHSHTTSEYSQEHINDSPSTQMSFSSFEFTSDSSSCIGIQKNSSDERKQEQKDDGDCRQVCLKEPMEMSDPPLLYSKYINKSSEKDMKEVFFKEDRQKEVFHRNLNEAPKEFIDQLVKEVYKTIVLAEENGIPPKHVMEIMKNNKSVQIDFENEEELMCLLQSHDDHFVLTPALGKVLISPRTDIKLCQAFTKDQSIKHDCTDLHICKYFLLGNCSLQHCKFSHRLTSKHNKKVLRAHGLEGLPEKAVKTLVRSIHNRNISTTPLICKFYNNEGGCQKGTVCMHLHLCMHYVIGNCKFGNACKRSHDIFEEQTRNILERHGLSEDRNRHDITNLLKATLKEGQVKLKRDLPSLSKRSPNILSSESTALSFEKASDVAKVSTMRSEGSKENQKPEDTVETSGQSHDCARLPDYIPLGQDEIHFQAECLDNGNDFIKGETKRSEINAKNTHTEKHFLPAWTPIWPVALKKTIEKNEHITMEKSNQDVEDTATSKCSITKPNEVVKVISATKGTFQSDGLLKKDDGRKNQNLKHLSITNNELLNIHTKTAIDENACNYTESKIANNKKEKSISKISNPTQDSEENGSDNSNITAVILEGKNIQHYVKAV